MQELKYTLRLMLCKPLLAMLAALVAICIVLAVVASVFVPSLTWQTALYSGAKFGGILAGAMWCIFFIKTFSAVSANSTAMPDADDELQAGSGESKPAEGKKD